MVFVVTKYRNKENEVMKLAIEYENYSEKVITTRIRKKMNSKGETIIDIYNGDRLIDSIIGPYDVITVSEHVIGDEYTYLKGPVQNDLENRILN